MGKDRQGFWFAVFLGEPVQIFLCKIIAFDKKDGSLGECPFEVSVSYFTAAWAALFPIGFFGAFYEAAVWGKVLYTGKAADIFYFVQYDQGDDSSNPGDGL